MAAISLESLQSKLREACRDGHLDQVKELVRAHKTCSSSGQCEFGTSLHESSSRGHFEIAEFLVREGAKLDTLDLHGRTPLQCAVSEGKDKVANLLVCYEVGADYFNKLKPALVRWSLGPRRVFFFSSMFTPSHLTAYPLRTQCTPLMLASAYGNSALVRDIISSGGGVNKADIEGLTALHYACWVESIEAVELLLNAGAHVDVLDMYQLSPLMLAAREGLFDIVKFLLECDTGGAAVTRADDNGLTILHYACRSQNTKVVQLVLQALKESVDNLTSAVNRTSNTGANALCDAFMCGSAVGVVELLLNAGARADGFVFVTFTKVACQNGSILSFMKQLLQSDSFGTDVNRTNSFRSTALHYACLQKNTIAVELLLNAGAHVDAQDYWGQTALMIASEKGHSAEVKLLILHGADVNMKTRERKTPLKLAATGNHTECGILLVEAGANMYSAMAQSVLSGATSAFTDAVRQAASFQTKKAICVVGNAMTGKSTLVASLKNEEASFFYKLWNYYGIKEISHRTTGIEPVPLNSKHYGSAMFFDFAGQQEYHGPHELFFKSILSRGLSTVTVIVVVKATEEGPAITSQLNRWLYPLSQASSVESNPVRIIVVASHMDKVAKQRSADTKECLESVYQDAKQAYAGAPLEFMGLVSLNCRLPYSEGISELRHYLNKVPIPRFKTKDVGYSTPWIISRIRSTIDEKVISVSNFVKWISRHRNDLPTYLPDAHILCRDLSATGHFLYLPIGQDLAEGWLLLDLPCILHEVYGTVFSPFNQKRIADQFGLVSVTTLADCFPAWNADLICEILTALEFAIKVDSTMCRELKGLSSEGEEGTNDQINHLHLFFPALVSSQRGNIFTNRKSFQLKWLFRVNSQSYITPFLLQSIIHCLILKHVLCHEQGTLCSKYQCRVWYNGIFWQTSSVDVAVQVSDSSVLQVIAATSDTSAEELFKYTTAVIGDISSTIHHFKLSPGLSGSSYIIYPGEPQTLLDNPQDVSLLHMFPVNYVLDSLKKNVTACLSLDCPAERVPISSLFCGFMPTVEDICGLLLSQPSVKASGIVDSGLVATPPPDTPTVEPPLQPPPAVDQSVIQQLLHKYRDRFKSDLNSHAVCLDLKVDNVISSQVCFDVQRVCPDTGNLLLLQHLREQADCQALQRFCKIVIQVGRQGHPNMCTLGQNLQRDLERLC